MYFRKFPTIPRIVMTIIRQKHVETMYQKPIVITKLQAIVVTKKFSSRPHLFRPVVFLQTFQKIRFEHSRSMAINRDQWLNNC